MDPPMELVEATKAAHIIDVTEEDGEASTEETPITSSKRKNHRGGKRKKGKAVEDTAATKKVYEVKESPGKGLGAFAIADIYRGTRLIDEKPVIHAAFGAVREEGPFALFASLPPKTQEAIRSLAIIPGLCLEQLREKIKVVAPDAAQYMRDLALESSEMIELTAIWMTNAFDTEQGQLLCLEASSINHSCLPNVNYCFNPSTGNLTVHAIRDITAGEEIFTSYIPSDGRRNARQEGLLRYGFTCNCAACQEGTPEAEAYERRRAQNFRHDREILRVMKAPGPRNHLGIIDIITGDIKVNFEEGGVLNMRMALYFLIVSNALAHIGDLEEGSKWLMSAVMVVESLKGTDHPEYAKYKRGLAVYAAIMEKFIARRSQI